jgi:hypothetical protein
MKKPILSMLAYGATAAVMLGLSLDHAAADGVDVCSALAGNQTLIDCQTTSGLGTSVGRAIVIALYAGNTYLMANHVSGPGGVWAKTKDLNNAIDRMVYDVGENDGSTMFTPWAFDGHLNGLCCQATTNIDI